MNTPNLFKRCLIDILSSNLNSNTPADSSYISQFKDNLLFKPFLTIKFISNDNNLPLETYFLAFSQYALLTSGT